MLQADRMIVIALGSREERTERARVSSRRALCAGLVMRRVRIAPDMAVVTTRVNVVRSGHVKRLAVTKLYPVRRERAHA